MKKFLPYILILVVLAAAAVWFVMHQSKGTISEQEGNFAVKEKKEIAKLVLTDTENKRIELTQQSGVWMGNGKNAAREELVAQLLDAVSRVTSLCPVPTAAHDNVIREMLKHHVKAEVFDAKGNLLKSYWVGGPSVDNQNTYMLLEIDGKPASRPHMCYIPGIKGYLTPRYGTDEENWKTRVLYNYKPEEIKSISLEYPGEEMNSFSINRVGPDSFDLFALDKKYQRIEDYKQSYIRQYLSFYSTIYIEAFDNTYSLKDSLLKTAPFATITITETDNSVNKVRLFRMPVSKRSKAQFDQKGNEMTYDVDHFYASIHNEQDFAIVQYYVFGKLLRNYKDFYFKPGN